MPKAPESTVTEAPATSPTATPVEIPDKVLSDSVPVMRGVTETMPKHTAPGEPDGVTEPEHHPLQPIIQELQQKIKKEDAAPEKDEKAKKPETAKKEETPEPKGEPGETITIGGEEVAVADLKAWRDAAQKQARQERGMNARERIAQRELRDMKANPQFAVLDRANRDPRFAQYIADVVDYFDHGVPAGRRASTTGDDEDLGAAEPTQDNQAIRNLQHQLNNVMAELASLKQEKTQSRVDADIEAVPDMAKEFGVTISDDDLADILQYAEQRRVLPTEAFKVLYFDQITKTPRKTRETIPAEDNGGGVVETRTRRPSSRQGLDAAEMEYSRGLNVSPDAALRAKAAIRKMNQ